MTALLRTAIAVVLVLFGALPPRADTRLAIVTKSPVVYGMSRMYAMMQVVRQTGEVEVFTSLDEAMTWLAR